MEVKLSGRMASSSSGNFLNKENPWDFIEKEIQEFQSIVKELEEYSVTSSQSVAKSHNDGSNHTDSPSSRLASLEQIEPESHHRENKSSTISIETTSVKRSSSSKHVLISTSPHSKDDEAGPPLPDTSPIRTRMTSEKPTPPPKPILRAKPALPPKVVTGTSGDIKKSDGGKVKGVPDYTTV